MTNHSYINKLLLKESLSLKNVTVDQMVINFQKSKEL